MYETGSAITSSGALSAYSGAKTGRSPSDKRVVKEESSEKDIWWGPVNKPMSPDVSLSYITSIHIICFALVAANLPCICMEEMAGTRRRGSGVMPPRLTNSPACLPRIRHGGGG